MLTYIDIKARGAQAKPRRRFEPSSVRVKRTVDFVIATLALILFLPGIIVVATLTLIADGRPLIFRHERIGQQGKKFNCLKFRTMRKDAVKMLETILATNDDRRREWEETQKLYNDPRVHWIGNILRATSLDELPQLINVIRGEMSIVGPRPIIQDELSRYGNDLDCYLAMTPGITGLWQISQRSENSYKERVELDVQYHFNQSIKLDFSIMLKTLPVLLFARNGK
ncbi:sugar transferase [Ahrensia sp. 13_GOM-1096m]|uniref:sugar transferase n=1 Tax=Ahrensia sp. 13_GOM-1096m TaxID=1380380 RepID=UPI000555D16D|nr:sugar transferase [Ahrensia sp. 13_GOM-1096m]